MTNKTHRSTLTKSIEILYTVVNNFSVELSEEYILNIYSLSSKIVKSNADFVVKYKLFDLLMLCFEKLDPPMDGNSISVCKDLLYSLRIASNIKHSDSGKYKYSTKIF